MVPLVFMIGTLNIALGFALALALEHRLVLHVPTWKRDPTLQETSPRRESPAAEQPEPPAPEAASPAVEEPAAGGQVQPAGVCGPVLADETLGTLQREVHVYLDTLQTLEDQVRGSLTDPNPALLQRTIDRLGAAAEQWLLRQCALVRTMADTRDQWGPHADVERHLEQLLLDQSPAIETSCRTLSAIDPVEDLDAVPRLTREVARLVRDAHQVRDGVQEAFASLAIRGNLAEPFDLAAHADRMTNLPDRVGLALLCCVWSRAADGQCRPRPIALLDVDDFGRANQILGTRAADELLQGMGTLLRREFAKGEAQVGRFSGQQYLLLWPDREPEVAREQLERLLAFVAETPLPCAGQEYRLTIRGGLTLLRPLEDVAEVFCRLEGLTELARQSGPHHMSIDVEAAPRITAAAPPAPAAHALPDRVGSADR